MAREWTSSQQVAMNTRGKLLLVSAAAGSGKTSVLTERIIRTLTDREHPADLSRMLVVTFTRAAAAELKSRIAAALTEALAENPGDTHLSRQLFLLGSAQISTIDSFFQQAVRSNFEQLGLPAAFRIADEQEVRELSLSIFDEVVRDFYDRYEPQKTETDGLFARLDENRFAVLMNHLLSNRNDADLDGDLLDFMQSFSSYPEGISLLKSYADELRQSSQKDFLSSVAGQTVTRQMSDTLQYYLAELRVAEEYLATDDQAAACFGGVLSYEIDCCSSLLDALAARSYAAVRAGLYAFDAIRFPRMVGKPQEMEVYKNLRKKLHESLFKYRDKLFFASKEEVRMQQLQTAELCEMLYELFSEYRVRILEEKKSRGVLEFDDVREMLHRLLTLPNGSPSPYAEALSEQYDAIYIDEYQDVDYLQDRIFSLIGGNRRFMVGDIKQSIYGFRGSEPSIFADYRRAMPLHTDPEAEHSDALCVFMSENFRCNRPVIDYANRICSFLFSACEESVGYRPQDDLVCSKPPLSQGFAPVPVQTVVFEPYPKPKKGEKADPKLPKREAVWVAGEIARLLREEHLDNGNPIDPSDIAILVRNASQGKDFEKELKALGIPVASSASDELLESPLMIDTLNLLRAIDNPYRDLPLSEYLLSNGGGFALEELALIRSSSPDCRALYDAMCAAAEDAVHPVFVKAKAWVEWLEGYRSIAAVQPADRFLRLLYLDPRLSPFSARPELMLLYEQARVYQRAAWCGLYGFLEHFTKLLAGKGIKAKGFEKAERAVTIMTIHRSKGLEFPVVFLASVGSRFNTDSLKDNLVFHRKVGVACKLYHPALHENINTVLREAVKMEIDADQTEESIRTLYVALTRARERMYVTGTTEGSPQTALQSAQMLRRGARASILGVGNSLRWILGAFQEFSRDPADFPCSFRIVPLSEEIGGIAIEAQAAEIRPVAPTAMTAAGAEALAILERQRQFIYPLQQLRGVPTKVAASKLRPDLLDSLTDEIDDLALDAQISLMQSDTPAFESLLQSNRQPSAAEIGTATHTFLELCDLSVLSERGIAAETERLVREQFLSPQTAKILNREQLEQFVRSDLMREILTAREVLREQKFNLLLPLRELTTDAQKAAIYEGQTVFVQGSIDLLLLTQDNRLLLFDYKTDRIDAWECENEALLRCRMKKRHGHQLACYARAVRGLFGREPDEIYIYSLPLGRTIPMN